jgi:hypothetical protein
VEPTSSKRPTAVSLKGPEEFRDVRGSGQKKHLCCQREIWRTGVLAPSPNSSVQPACRLFGFFEA